MNKPLDFFGNEIEVGDEVALQITALNKEYKPYNLIIKGYVEGFSGKTVRVLPLRSDFGLWDKITLRKGNNLIVNTEKKHREKALDYLAAEAQDLGMYDEAVGVTSLREGFE